MPKAENKQITPSTEVKPPAPFGSAIATHGDFGGAKPQEEPKKEDETTTHEPA